MEAERSPLSSPRLSDDAQTPPEDGISGSSDPRWVDGEETRRSFLPYVAAFRSSQLDPHIEPVEKHAPVKRKKFPLGASENERRSKSVIIERF